MLTKRIIPCFDVKDGQIVKGINFKNLRYAGDPVKMSKIYVEQGADELVFLDITATLEKRKTLLDLVQKIAREINIPFTVGGGIRSVDDVSSLLKAGADKVSINSAAIVVPKLIHDLSSEFGSQCIVVAIDAKRENDSWRVYINAGEKETEWGALEWAKKAEALGAGEILLTSMDHDGTKQGFAIELTRRISELISIPVIASGGAGIIDHFADVFTRGKADAALAASIFHFGEIDISRLKHDLDEKNIPVRI